MSSDNTEIAKKLPLWPLELAKGLLLFSTAVLLLFRRELHVHSTLALVFAFFPAWWLIYSNPGKRLTVVMFITGFIFIALAFL